MEWREKMRDQNHHSEPEDQSRLYDGQRKLRQHKEQKQTVHKKLKKYIKMAIKDPWNQGLTRMATEWASTASLETLDRKTVIISSAEKQNCLWKLLLCTCLRHICFITAHQKGEHIQEGSPKPQMNKNSQGPPYGISAELYTPLDYSIPRQQKRGILFCLSVLYVRLFVPSSVTPMNTFYRLDVYEISSIKIFGKSINTPRVVSMYYTGSSPRFWIWLSFFECFGILSASLLSIFWVLSSKYFGVNAAEERSLLEICIYSISKFPLFSIRLVHIF